MNQIDFNLYYEKIGNNQTAEVIEDLMGLLPQFKKELTLVQRRFTANQSNKLAGTLKREDYETENNSINGDLIAFMDSLSKGNQSQALDYLDPVPSIDDDSPVDDLISNQLNYSERTIKENKIFRNTVGILFVVAIMLTA